MNQKPLYLKGFLPFAIAAAVMSLCGGFTAAIPTNIVNDWDLAVSDVSWITLAYALGAAALAPIMGKLGDVTGRRKILITSLVIYTLGQMLIAFCPTGSLALVLIFRFIVGVGAAGISPAVMSYIMTEFPPQKMGQGFTIYMLVSCGMVIFGPVTGGIIMTLVGWRPVMYICVAASAIALISCILLIKKENVAKKTLEGFDFKGSVCVLVFFSMFLSVPTFGQTNCWLSTQTLICLAVGLVTFFVLFAVEKSAKNPILNGKFMARKEFILPVIALFLSQGLLQSCMVNVITFSKLTTQDSVLAGIATSVMYFGMALGTVIIGPKADKKEPRNVAAVALVFVLFGTAMQLLFTSSTSLLLMCASLFLIGLGLGGNATIFLKVVLVGLNPTVAGSGSGTYNVFRDMSAPFGVALFVPMFSTGFATVKANYISQGMDETVAQVTACVESIHSTAIIQVVCVIAAIIVCMLIPKIRTKA